MNMPIFLDNTKDKVLIEWLGKKTNRSAAIREVLYFYLNNSVPPPKVIMEEEEDEDDEDFISCLNNFKED